MALELAEKAREKEDYRTAATCLAQAVAATGQIKPLATTEGEQQPKESGFMKCYMEQAEKLYATESQTDRKASVRLEASQPETKADPVLVDSRKP